MMDQISSVPQSAREILGDLAALSQQLGRAEGLRDWSVAAGWAPSTAIQSLRELEVFLGDYSAGLLIPHELPGVLLAYQHAGRNEVRELIELDRKLARVPGPASFATASWRVGKTQLRRLRPLRGERVVQRYLQAVERHQAKGWHTLVYGLVLAVYSLPLRQGLAHFAYQTLGGFVHSAAHRLRLPESDVRRLVADQDEVVFDAVQQVIAQHSSSPVVQT